MGVAQLFLDDRGQALRVTWHAEPGVVVLSIWRARACVGTVRLPPSEAHRLAGFLEQAASADAGPADTGPADTGRADDGPAETAGTEETPAT